MTSPALISFEGSAAVKLGTRLPTIPCRAVLRFCGIFKDAVISIPATIAKQERIRLSEPVQAGLARARGRGKRLGRPKKIVDASRIARLRSGISRGTAQRTVSSLPKSV
jgi:DNA invertase Pin-like site-specific DNA recombinase